MGWRGKWRSIGKDGGVRGDEGLGGGVEVVVEVIEVFDSVEVMEEVLGECE